jgi:hypothetical protein
MADDELQLQETAVGILQAKAADILQVKAAGMLQIPTNSPMWPVPGDRELKAEWRRWLTTVTSDGQVCASAAITGKRSDLTHNRCSILSICW